MICLEDYKKENYAYFGEVFWFPETGKFMVYTSEEYDQDFTTDYRKKGLLDRPFMCTESGKFFFRYAVSKWKDMEDTQWTMEIQLIKDINLVPEELKALKLLMEVSQ